MAGVSRQAFLDQAVDLVASSVAEDQAVSVVVAPGGDVDEHDGIVADDSEVPTRGELDDRLLGLERRDRTEIAANVEAQVGVDRSVHGFA